MTQISTDFRKFPISASSNSIETHVKNVRIKIDGGSKKSLIRTIRGVGYALDLRDVWASKQ
jgi:DNA-binding response OmpR family regulator